jgi:hypothetical protein
VWRWVIDWNRSGQLNVWYSGFVLHWWVQVSGVLFKLQVQFQFQFRDFSFQFQFQFQFSISV